VPHAGCAGPYATQILRDLGAEVIKIEDNAGGDYVRYYPPLGPDGNSAQFHALNRGKKSVVLDLKSDSDRAAFYDLVATAHVVVETFRPGVMAKLKCGPKDLQKVNPKLIFCSISGYGQTGPDSTGTCTSSHLRVCC
jgi:crotonobetainyl-CoA:carnitine CoA-transferase CaiB-like acyl-CoA transferase